MEVYDALARSRGGGQRVVLVTVLAVEELRDAAAAATRSQRGTARQRKG